MRMIALTLVAMSRRAKRENLGYAERFHVKVTQMFRSSKDERVISETEIGELDADYVNPYQRETKFVGSS